MNKHRTQIAFTVDDDILQELEDYRFDNRFPTRAAALTSLLLKGLQAAKQEQSDRRKA